MSHGPNKADRLEAFREVIADGLVDETLERAYDEVIDRAGDDADLTTEIGGLRLLLHRTMAVELFDGDSYEAGMLVAELVRSITKAVRSQRQVSGSATDDLAGAVDRVLGDLGLGEVDG